MVRGNQFWKNPGDALAIHFSNFNSILDNEFYYSGKAIEIHQSSNSCIKNNTIYGSGQHGIHISESYDIDMIDNTISSSGGFGTYLWWSNTSKIFNNTFVNNGIVIEGYELSHFNSHIIPTNNTVNGDPLYYFKDTDGVIIDGIPVGQIIITNCNHFLMRNLNINNTDVGIEIGYAGTNNTIINNTISNNYYGIYSIRGGTNHIYHNDIIDNTIQAVDTWYKNNWDNGYPSGGNFWSDYRGNDFFSGPNQNITGNDGIGDTENTIDSDSVDYYPLMFPIGDYIFLYEGWNLISLPCIQSDTDLGSVLEPIEGSWDTICRYNASDDLDPWKLNNTSKPPNMNDLEDVNHTMGFWINITEPEGILFEYLGTQPTQPQSIVLYPGWNMVGYPSLSRKNRSVALNTITFGNEVDAIWTFQNAGQKWDEIEESDYFELGKGYWIHATMKCVWEVPL
jgi:parallel beta-helix repeat protein